MEVLIYKYTIYVLYGGNMLGKLELFDLIEYVMYCIVVSSNVGNKTLSSASHCAKFYVTKLFIFLIKM